MSGGNKRKKKKENKEERRKMVMAFVCLFLVFLLFAGFLIKIGVDKALYNRFEDRGLPRINIELNGVSLDEIKNGLKETKYKDNELVLYNDGRVDEFRNVEVKGRGNSTWKNAKKPFQIGFKNKVDLLKLGKAKKWVLLASRADYSLLRNDAALKLAEILEIKYSHRGEFVELYIDGVYEGLYYILQKINIAKTSVDLREIGGVLFELDNVYVDRENEEYYESKLGNTLVLKDIKPDNEKDKKIIVDDFLNDFNSLEVAAQKGDYEKVAEIINVQSFAKYYLISEFTVNPDAYSTSFYLYKDGMNGKIQAGPVWEFDLALGNHNWAWEVDERVYSPSEDMIRKREAFGEDGLTENKYISKIMYYLMEIPDFREEVKQVFQEKMSGKVGELIKAMQDKKSEIQIAMIENSEKWKINDSEKEIEYLLDWVTRRYKHFEFEYGNNDIDWINDRKYSQSL